jgi:hypothetical protein
MEPYNIALTRMRKCRAVTINRSAAVEIDTAKRAAILREVIKYNKCEGIHPAQDFGLLKESRWKDRI